jgi:IclR family acetate operon transcriptional repressor
VSQAPGIPKTTAFSYLQALSRAAFPEHHAYKDRYSVGPRLRSMARTASSISRARELAHLVPIAQRKALHAHMPQLEAQDYLGRPLMERTGFTLIERDELECHLRQIAHNGYAIETGENEDGAMCVGAPILDDQGYPLVAMIIAVPTARMSTSDAMVAGHKLSVMAAKNLSILGQRLAAQVRAAEGEGRTPFPTSLTG